MKRAEIIYKEIIGKEQVEISLSVGAATALFKVNLFSSCQHSFLILYLNKRLYIPTMYNADQNRNVWRDSDERRNAPKNESSHRSSDQGDEDTDSTDSNREMVIRRNVKTSE